MSLTNNRWHVVKDYDAGFVGVGCTVSWTCLGIADIHPDVPNIEERVEVAELIALAPTLKKENEQLQATNKELLSVLEAFVDAEPLWMPRYVDSENETEGKALTKLAGKCRQAITNAKRVMGDSDE